jgi:phage terminase small subunit
MLFVKEYLIDLNATQAAIRAGYSEKTANEQGARLLANVSVSEAIQHGMNERSKRTEITADYVLNTIVETIECDSLSNDY